jgi:hypothetical protein
VDELIEHFIIENRLTLTLLAMFFTPVGLYAAVRFLQPRDSREPRDDARSAEVERRLASMERTIGLLADEVSRMSEQQRRLVAEPDPRRIPRANTPV